MTLVANAAADTTTTTGTGAVTLSGTAQAITINGAPATTFATAFTYAGTIAYPISGVGYQITDGTNTETGTGTLTSATNLTRDMIIASSNGGRHVNFIAGTKSVTSTPSWSSAFVNATSAPPQTLPENDVQSGTFSGVLTDGVGTTAIVIQYKVSGAGQVTMKLPTTTVNNTGTTLSITGVPASLSPGAASAVPCLVTGTAAGGVTVPGIASLAAGATVQGTGTITFQQYTAAAFPALFTATFTASVVRGVPAQTLTWDLV